MTTTTAPAILLRNLIPHLGVGTLAHLRALNLATIDDVLGRAEREGLTTREVLLWTGMPGTRADEFCEAITRVKGGVIS